MWKKVFIFSDSLCYYKISLRELGRGKDKVFLRQEVFQCEMFQLSKFGEIAHRIVKTCFAYFQHSCILRMCTPFTEHNFKLQLLITVS